jgi:hypothetical protein
MGVVNRSTTELRTFGEGFFPGFADVTFELQSNFADGTRGGAEWVMRGRYKSSCPECQLRAARGGMRSIDL